MHVHAVVRRLCTRVQFVARKLGDDLDLVPVSVRSMQSMQNPYLPLEVSSSTMSSTSRGSTAVLSIPMYILNLVLVYIGHISRGHLTFELRVRVSFFSVCT
jgi:hypothetical protein